MASVKVAVRVRPLNQREHELNSKMIISMEGKKTLITNTKVSPGSADGELGRSRIKEFTFDYSYWSCNSTDSYFASQQQVFQDLGKEVVENAFQGYNACIFAYGQTGSGKTYTMMGTPDSEGLIPRICEALFTKMKISRNAGATFRTEVSYLEIYNERVKDLLRKKAVQHNLKVREHPKLGPYVQDLSRHLVMDYSDVQELMTRGNSHRTTAATTMNDVSSRSHAIFTLTFSQANFSHDMPSETMSKVNLVDLAGSERADVTGATGQRLKEGGHINKSLVTLGTVISALADISSSQTKKQIFIPYRDSVLTWLLKDSLGGNSKTIMIATISPAECNYGETLSTLRYANRAKNIINKPTINEDPNVKLIRDLRSEIEHLKSLLLDSNNSPMMIEKLHENEARVKILTEEWTERWKETHKILKEQRTLGLRKFGQGVILDSELPHLIGIDDDVLSTGITLYHLKEGMTYIGTENASRKQEIVLNGLGIDDEHCIVELQDGKATLIPLGNSECYVNTIMIDKPSPLSQGCVILLGKTNMFRYNDPAEVERLRKDKERGSALNLSRLSLLSRSASDLARSVENLNSPIKQVASEDEIYKTDEDSLYLRESEFQERPDDFQDKTMALKSVEAQFQRLQQGLERSWNAVEEKRLQGIDHIEMDQFQQQELEQQKRINCLVEQEVQRRLFEEKLCMEQQLLEEQGQESQPYRRDLINFHQQFEPRFLTYPVSPGISCNTVNDLDRDDSIVELFADKPISISIPSYTMRGSGSGAHYEYEIKIYVMTDNWTIYRRYKRFRELHQYMRLKYGDKVHLPYFPPRKIFGRRSERVVEERRKHLEIYLNKLVEACIKIESCPLYCLESHLPCKQDMYDFAPFFHKGCFETSKHGTG